MAGKTYAGIDRFRLAAAYMVIAIHVSPFAIWDPYVDSLITGCLCRVAVPFFFMVTGYFVLSPYAGCREGVYIKRVFRRYIMKNTGLYLAVTILYLPISLYAGQVPHSAAGLVRWFFFDGTFYHLWYFPAAVIGSILLVHIMKGSFRRAVCFSLAAYAAGLMGDSYYGAAERIPFLHFFYEGIFRISTYTRNGIFFAPVFLLLGVLTADPRWRCPLKVCAWGLEISLALMLLEGAFTRGMGLQRHNSMYLFLLPAMYFLFQLLLAVPGTAPAGTGRLFERGDSAGSGFRSYAWTRQVSTWIYILHPAVIIFVRKAAKVTGLEELLVENTMVHYLAVCAVSLVAALLIGNMVSKKERHRGRALRSGKSSDRFKERRRQP